jgi:hypothetical protein
MIAKLRGELINAVQLAKEGVSLDMSEIMTAEEVINETAFFDLCEKDLIDGCFDKSFTAPDSVSYGHPRVPHSNKVRFPTHRHPIDT